MTKVTFISDTHELHRETKIEDTDILIHCGDITNMSSFQVLHDFNDWLKEQPSSYNVVIAGNHDFCFEQKPRICKGILSNAIYLENQSTKVMGLKIWGSPVTPKFFNWGFGYYGDERQMLWEEIPQDLDILLTHGPPLFTLDKNPEGESVGCGYLAARVQITKPKYHAFGHIHESAGMVKKGETTYINASQMGMNYNYCNKPIVVKL